MNKKTIIIVYLLLFGITAQAQQALQKYYTAVQTLESQPNSEKNSAERGKALAVFHDERVKEAGSETAKNETTKLLRQYIDYDFFAAYYFTLRLINFDDGKYFHTNYFNADEQTKYKLLSNRTVQAYNTRSEQPYPSGVPYPGKGVKGSWQNSGIAATLKDPNSNLASTSSITNNGKEDYDKGFSAEMAKNYTEALKWYRLSADKGNAQGMYGLGVAYYKGQGIAKNEAEGIAWLQKAAEKGDKWAPAFLKNINQQIPTNTVAKTTDNGDEEHKKGHGAYQAQNYTEAFSWYKKAADKGNVIAIYNIAVMYANGNGVTQNYTEAMNLYKKAADKGHEKALFNLGTMYFQGQGVAKNEVEAKAWYQKAADKGLADAMYNLGLMHKNGYGTTINYAEAKTWLQKAADKEHEQAKATLQNLTNDPIAAIKVTATAPPTPVKPIINKAVSYLGKNGLYGLADRSGKVIIQPQYDFALRFYNGVAIAGKNKKRGLINSSFKELTPFEYDSDLGYSDGLFQLIKKKPLPSNSLNEETYFLDATGKVVLTDADKPYKIKGPFYSERALVWTANGTGYIDKKGKMVIPDIYNSSGLFGTSSYWFTDGVAIAKQKDGNLGVIDVSGKMLTSKSYSTITGNTSLFVRKTWEGVFIYMTKEEKYGYLDKNGKEITTAKYDNAFPFQQGRGKVSIGKNTFKQGFVDRTGKEVIPLIYDIVSDFSESLAAVKLQNKWGYIDLLGNMVIQPQFEAAFEFNEGLAAVKMYGKTGFINKKGEWVIAPYFNSTSGKFVEGLVGILQNNKWGFINTKGEVVIQPKYTKYGFTDFEDGLKHFEVEDVKFIYIDKTGKEFREN